MKIQLIRSDLVSVKQYLNHLLWTQSTNPLMCSLPIRLETRIFKQWHAKKANYQTKESNFEQTNWLLCRAVVSFGNNLSTKRCSTSDGVYPDDDKWVANAPFLELFTFYLIFKPCVYICHFIFCFVYNWMVGQKNKFFCHFFLTELNNDVVSCF